MASAGGELGAALAVIDVIDSMAAPVHALVTAEAGGAALAVLAAAEKRAAYRHARFKLAEPRAAGVTGTADEVAAAAGQHLRELEEIVLRLVDGDRPVAQPDRGRPVRRPHLTARGGRRLRPDRRGRRQGQHERGPGLQDPRPLRA